jgi:hypothetical protein
VGTVVGMTNPLQVSGCINGHEISWTPITKNCDNTLGASIFFIVITKKHELSTIIVIKKKKVGFLKCLMLTNVGFQVRKKRCINRNNTSPGRRCT